MIVAKLLLAVLLIAATSAKPTYRQSYRGQVVFIGDSITDFWRQNGWQAWAQYYEPVGAVNVGVAGDLTTNTMQRINDGVIDNLNSKLAVLMIGTNDLAWGGLNEQQVVSNIGLIINQIKQKNPGGVKILLMAVLPRVEADIHQKIQTLNTLIPQYVNNNDIFFLDMGDKFATGRGQIIPNLYADGVHLTPDGYNVWADAMNPLFFELLNGEAPSTSAPITTTAGTTTKNPNPDYGQVVFLGDSITDFWRTEGIETWNIFYAPLGAVNTGVAGDLTTNTIQRITNEGIIDNLNSRLAVLKIGTNDLSWGVADAEIVANIGQILNLLRQKSPGIKILLLGILPRAPAEIHLRARNVNAELSKYASAEDVYFLDMNDAFSHDLGMVFPELYWDDYLHINAAGYVRWAETMNELFFQILGLVPPTTIAPSTTTKNPNVGSVVFLGDSITDFWRNEGKVTWDQFYEPLGAVNTGVAGDLTTNTIARITNDGIIDNLNAKVAVLKIGTNDLSWGVGDAEIIGNIGQILNLIRQRNTGVKILLLGILPRAPKEIHQRAGAVNAELSKYAEANDVWFLDMNNAFSYDWGMVFPELYWDDFLHINAAGYVKWAETMNPLFFELYNS